MRLGWLADRLAELAPDRPRAEVLRHTGLIRGAWVAWYHRFDVFAVVIEGAEPQLYARRVEVKDSPGRELKRLYAATERGTREEYSRGWEGTSGRTQRLVLRGWAAVPPPVIGRERADFTVGHNYLAVDYLADGNGEAPAHISIRPLQAEAVPLVKAALQEYQAIPRRAYGFQVTLARLPVSLE